MYILSLRTFLTLHKNYFTSDCFMNRMYSIPAKKIQQKHTCKKRERQSEGGEIKKYDLCVCEIFTSILT